MPPRVGQGPVIVVYRRGVVTKTPRRPIRIPTGCPVCGGRLHTTRLSCESCGTELSGQFPTCAFCSLEPNDRELLEVFLRARGNLKEVERHLGVSYPTARARLDSVLARLGLAPEPPSEDLDLLRAVARGDVDLGEAAQRLRGD